MITLKLMILPLNEDPKRAPRTRSWVLNLVIFTFYRVLQIALNGLWEGSEVPPYSLTCKGLDPQYR